MEGKKGPDAQEELRANHPPAAVFFGKEAPIWFANRIGREPRVLCGFGLYVATSVLSSRILP